MVSLLGASHLNAQGCANWRAAVLPRCGFVARSHLSRSAALVVRMAGRLLLDRVLGSAVVFVTCLGGASAPSGRLTDV